ncbi:MAG: flavodoxin family protein, partial [Candidatus Riflebacteria bacterium]|nr:flavodoxin family protein [Candidatus Riflebacteria bacterium]
MKVIVLNGSPRTNFNTAQLLKQAQKGAESVGAEVEYYDLIKI